MPFCPTCEENFPGATTCPKCGRFFQDVPASNNEDTNKPTTISEPAVCASLRIIAWLNLIGGIIAGLFFLARKYEEPLIVPGITCIVAGVIGAVIFWAGSEVINYLHVINENIFSLRQENKRVKADKL